MRKNVRHHGGSIMGERESETSAHRTFAAWTAGVTATLALGSFAVAATTPPRSGPFAQPAVALAYPYAEAARYVPRDFLWMYPATFMMLAFVVLSSCILDRARPDRRLFGIIGTSLATASFVIIALDYFVQFRTVQVALIRGEAAGVVALSQYNPHGVFIALEEAGFVIASVSFVFLAFALGSSKAERVAKWVLLIAGALALLALGGMSAAFGLGIEYRFEVAVITIVWLTLATTGALLAWAFARSGD